MEVLNSTILPILINGRLHKFPVHVFKNLNTKAILGMDFLSKFQANINAAAKTVSFPPPDPEFNVFSTQAVTIPPHAVRSVTSKCHLQGLGYVTNDVLSIDEILFENTNGRFSVSVHNPTYVEMEIPKDFPLATFVPCLSTDVISVKEYLTQPQTPPTYAQVAALNSSSSSSSYTDKKPVLQAPPLSAEKRKFITDNVQTDLPDKDKLLRLLFKYHDCISANKHDLGRSSIIKHKIDLKSHDPVHKKQFRIPEEHLPFLHEYVDNLEKSGCIQISHSPWNSPLFLVKKHHGSSSFRLVQDFRALNAQTFENKYAMKEIQEYIDSIGRSRSKVFSKMDLTSGYWQQELEPSSRKYTAFTVPGKARYEFTVSAQGLCGSPSSFAMLTTALVRGLSACQAYLDDLLCMSQTEMDHFSHLEQLFQRLRRFNLKINISKSQFFAAKMDFLGHEISANGVKVSDEKIKAIKEYPSPTSIKKVRQFTGLANYFRNYIQNYALITGHLSRLLRKNSGWKKGPLPPIAEAAFQKIKAILVSAPVLSYPIPNTPYILSVDAATGDESSPGGLGAILSQLDENNVERIVSYASRSLKEHEKNYSAFLLELQASVWAIDHFSVYLTGRKFTLQTDSKPVEKLSKMHTKTFHRLQQLMNQFDFVVQYRKGAANAAPDALSRNPVDAISIDQQTKFNLPKFQNKDPEIKALYNFLKFKKLPENKKLQKFVSTYGHISLLQNNIVFVNVKVGKELKPLVFAPKVWRLPLITEAHAGRFSGHKGVFRTVQTLLLSYFWPGMSSQVTQFIKHCPICLKVSRPNFKTMNTPLTPLPITTQPNTRVHMDLIGPLKSTSANQYIACFTDSFSKYAVTVALVSKEAKIVAKAFLDNWIFKFGPPKEILSDLGREFVNETMEQIAMLADIKTIRTSSYRAATNGQCERFNRTLIRILTSMIANNQKSSLSWEELLPIATFSYNIAVHKQTTYSPFFLTFLHHPNLPFFDHKFDEPPKSWPEDIFQSVQEIYDDVVKELNAKIPPTKGEFREFNVGDRVLVAFPKQLTASKEKPAGNKKFQTHFQNNFKIVKKISPSAFHVKRPYGRPTVVNADRFKHDLSFVHLSSRPVTRSMAKLQDISQTKKKQPIFIEIDLEPPVTPSPPNSPQPAQQQQQQAHFHPPNSVFQQMYSVFWPPPHHLRAHTPPPQRYTAKTPKSVSKSAFAITGQPVSGHPSLLA